MNSSELGSKIRQPRADALRNRNLILEVAREAFAEQGPDVTFEEIVRLSGLGVGTLYRHFPSRDALIEAMYLAEVERLVEAEREISAAEPPVEALRQWMRLFVEFMATKSALKRSFAGLGSGNDCLYTQTTELITSAMNRLTQRAVGTGELWIGVEPIDLLRALSGVAHATDDATATENALRMVDILIAGLRTGPR